MWPTLFENGKQLTLKGRVHQIRVKGKKRAFVIIRSRHNTLQLITESETLITQTINQLNLEDIVEVTGKIQELPAGSVKSCTISNFELEIEEIKIRSKCNDDQLPMLIYNNKIESHLDTILEHRSFSLRTLENQAIFAIQSLICQYFRKYLNQRGFIEIHTPKIISTASESGAQVFSVNCYERQKYLCQSPQLHKQALINSGFERVYEIGPVFRAERSSGPRHLFEFNSMDLETEIQTDYKEVIHLLYGLLTYIIGNLERSHKDLLNSVQTYRPLVYPEEPLIIEYMDALTMLKEVYGSEATLDYNYDINQADEKRIGELVKEKYQSDIVVLNRYPKVFRPFYSKTSSSDPLLTNSYDIILRGNEILSGSERVNNYETLLDNLKIQGVNPETLSEYLESFKHGSPNHGGGAFGLERLTMFILNLPNIKLASLYPNYY